MREDVCMIELRIKNVRTILEMVMAIAAVSDLHIIRYISKGRYLQIVLGPTEIQL